MTHNRSLGGRLQEERKRAGLSQTAFADVMGISRRTQSMYETGDGDPSAFYLQRAQEKGVDLVYVLTGRRSIAPVSSLSQDESELLEIFSKLQQPDRAFLLRVATTLIGT